MLEARIRSEKGESAVKFISSVDNLFNSGQKFMQSVHAAVNFLQAANNEVVEAKRGGGGGICFPGNI